MQCVLFLRLLSNFCFFNFGLIVDHMLLIMTFFIVILLRFPEVLEFVSFHFSPNLGNFCTFYFQTLSSLFSLPPFYLTPVIQMLDSFMLLHRSSVAPEALFIFLLVFSSLFFRYNIFCWSNFTFTDFLSSTFSS